MKYTDKIVFSNVKGTGINLNTGLPIFSRKYVKNEAGEIESTKPVINVVDIDWNGAQLPNKDVEINSTGDLLELIDNMNGSSDISLDGYATEEYVNSKVSELIGMAPETLDTIEELATAVQNNKSVIDTLEEVAVSKAETEYVNTRFSYLEGLINNVSKAEGPQGPQGPQGSQGMQGYRGVQGAQGIKGDQGAQGAPGAQGAQGPQGSQGMQGYRGVQGAQGIKGDQGPQGPQGDQGAQGAQGDQGPQGAQGDQGVQGPQGAQGIKGDQGAQGAPGTPGISEEFINNKVEGLASEEYVNTKLADLVNSAPETLDTLGEIAEALENNHSAIESLEQIASSKASVEYVDNKVASIEIPSVEGLASEEYVDNKVAGIEIPSVEGLASEETVMAYMEAMTNRIESLEIPSVEGLASETYVNDKIRQVIGEAPETLDTLQELATAITYNDGIISALDAAITSKASVEYVDNKVAAIEIPSVDGLASTEYVDNKVGEIEIPEIPTRVSEFENDANYLTEHQDLSDYVTYEEYNELYDKFEALQQYVDVYLKLSDEELAAKNAAIISSLSADNTSVELPAGEVSEINLPEATKTYKVTANLADDTVINLTSSKAASIINTADNVPNVTIIAPEVEGATTQAPNVSLKGDFDTLTIENISVTNVSGGLLAPTVPITVNNLVVSENTSRPVRVNAAFNEGATVTNNSDCELILQNLNTEDPTNVTVVAPQSTVTLYGTWQTLEAEVGDNTLVVNPAARIDRLVVKRGNVLVKSAYVEDCINSVVNDPANYTEAPQNESGLWEVSALVNEVGDLAAFKKVATTPSLIRFTNDIANTAAISYGIVTSGHIVYDLNGHTYSTSGVSKTAVLFARGSNLTVDITGNGSIIGPELASAYGIWLTASTATYNPTVNIYSGTIIGATHTLYVERGTMNVYGGTFKMYELDSEKDVNGNFKFMLNCYDENFRNGTAHINVYGGTFWDFNPAEAYGEPGAPVSYVAEGYHVEMTTVVENEVEHKVYTVVAD